MKKIKLFILMFLISLILSGCNLKLLTTQEYQDEIVDIENDINQLSKDIEELKNKIALLEAEYQQLSNELDSLLTKEDMYKWLNQCDIYNARGNMKVEVEYSKTFIGITTSTDKYSASGFIFYSVNNTYYVLTTYNITNKTGYNKVSYKLIDAFQTDYTASLYKASEEYGLAVLSFTDDKAQNDLYTVKFADSDPKVNDPVCNIYSLQNSAFNHMNFSKVDNYVKISTYDFEVFYSDVDTVNSIYGAMSVDLDGNLVGMASVTYNEDGMKIASIPVSKIKEYLVSINLY